MSNTLLRRSLGTKLRLAILGTTLVALVLALAGAPAAPPTAALAAPGQQLPAFASGEAGDGVEVESASASGTNARTTAFVPARLASL